MNPAELLRQHGLRPDKRLGQNFLVDEAALDKIIAAAALTGGETVLEIGPGLGALTLRLAAAARQVTAVELDARLIPILEQVLSAAPNVRIVQGDILALDPADLVDAPEYCVAANIPYYITSALIRRLLGRTARPTRLTLTVQREVAERLCAAPGEMSLLALSVQVFGAPSLRGRIPAGAFYPAPQVDSAIARVDLYPQPRIPAERLDDFFRLAKAAFSQKRKTLRNALAGGLRWSAAQAGDFLLSAGVDPMRRAETLSLEEWGALTERFVVSSHHANQPPAR
ncbi:MAG: 16S rRNA (adenine(1518)-N(6)/adenine(1519)-N(6))-dimethyltransferase RsmA [Chloroflexi bacterium]|nr:16S rRNA (adenine(1518)-N(6)/adenine(1519)-N(6))-dimethyltransferase RsmA [Chloroflexota bacterium]